MSAFETVSTRAVYDANSDESTEYFAVVTLKGSPSLCATYENHPYSERRRWRLPVTHKHGSSSTTTHTHGSGAFIFVGRRGYGVLTLQLNSHMKRADFHLMQFKNNFLLSTHCENVDFPTSRKHQMSGGYFQVLFYTK